MQSLEWSLDNKYNHYMYWVITNVVTMVFVKFCGKIKAVP